MTFVIILSLLFGFGYTWLIRHIYVSWMEVPAWSIPKSYTATQKVSIVVAARNEEDNIDSCINSLISQSYPSHLVEIIIVDDFSEDQTTAIVNRYADQHVQLIKLSETLPDLTGPAFKKNAIAQGIRHSTGHIIMTTDADCVVPRHWVASLVSYLEEKNLAYTTAPVRIKPSTTWLEKFQSIEMLGMNAVTAFGLHTRKILLSNGANLAFKKEIFDRLQGFDQIDMIASGDDILFMQKVYQDDPNSIGYCKSHTAFVDTQPAHTFHDLIRQRIRWASKYNHLKSPWTKYIMAGILLYSILLFIFFIFGIVINIYFLLAFIILIFFKGRIDYWYLKNLSREFNQPKLIRSFLPSFLFYPIQIFCVGVTSLFRKDYIWKGRRVS